MKVVFFKMSSLPPGITDSMLEPDDPPCGRCGHAWSDHLDEDDVVYNSYGEIVIACNMKHCDGCAGFSDDEYTPSWQPDTYEEYYG